MRALPPGSRHAVRVDDLPWRPSTMAPGILVRDIAATDGVDRVADSDPRVGPTAGGERPA